jgi:hypothetical protein
MNHDKAFENKHIKKALEIAIYNLRSNKLIARNDTKLLLKPLKKQLLKNRS